jgi:hypothetical protein
MPFPPRSTMSIEAGGATKPETEDFGSDLEVENNKFAFPLTQLGKLYNPKSLGAFDPLGGLDSIEKGLKTDRAIGLDETSLSSMASLEGATESDIAPAEKRTTMPGDAEPYCVSLQSYPSGNPLLAAFTNSDESFHLFRSFSSLHNRIILDQRDKLCELEQELLDMDKATENLEWCRRQKSMHAKDDPFARGRSPVGKGTIRNAAFIARWSSTFSNTAYENWNLQTQPPELDIPDTEFDLEGEMGAPMPHFGQLVNPAVTNETAALVDTFWGTSLGALSMIMVNRITKLGHSVDWLLSRIAKGTYTVTRSSLRTVTASPLLVGLSLFSLITPSNGQGIAAGPHNRVELDWRQRALGALTDNLVMLAFLVFPLMVLTITGCAADRFRRNSQEGKAAFSMLGMAVIFISIPAPSGDKSASNNDQYMRAAIGLSYAFFMTAHCMLIALRHRWYKGRCAIAGGLAILMTIAGMASASVQSYWTASTKTDPVFALSIAIPASFTLCDLTAYLSDAINGARAPGLPAPVPGPQQGA